MLANLLLSHEKQAFLTVMPFVNGA